MTCKNCKSWTRYEPPGDPFTPSKPEYMGECSNGKFVYTGRANLEDYPVDGLAYSDDEGYRAYIYTGEEFGCIHFEAK